MPCNDALLLGDIHQHLAECAALAIGLARADIGKFIAAGLHHIDPFLGDDSLALPYAATQIQLAQLGHILGVDIKTGCTDGIALRTLAPCHFAEAKRIEQTLPEQIIHLFPALLADDAREQIKCGVAIRPLGAGDEIQLGVEQIGQIVVRAQPRRIDGIDIQITERKTAGVGQRVMHGHQTPIGIHILGQLVRKDVHDALVYIKQSVVVQHADGGGHECLGHGIAVLAGVAGVECDGFDIALMDLGDLIERAAALFGGLGHVFQKFAHFVTSVCAESSAILFLRATSASAGSSISATVCSMGQMPSPLRLMMCSVSVSYSTATPWDLR